MTNHSGRGRIEVLALDINYRRAHFANLARSLPRGWIAEALTGDGLLARCRITGTLATWQGDRMVSVDRRKAEAALLRA